MGRWILAIAVAGMLSVTAGMDTNTAEAGRYYYGGPRGPARVYARGYYRGYDRGYYRNPYRYNSYNYGRNRGYYGYPGYGRRGYYAPPGYYSRNFGVNRNGIYFRF